MKKNIAWIDTIRVLASLLVIFCHYFMCDGFSFETRMKVHLYEWASVSVFLFFAISGYLVHGSLVRTPSLKEFYKRKLVRLIVPFTVAWFVLATLMSILSLLNSDITEKVTLFHALFGAKYFSLILGMFPVDLNVTFFFDIKVDWFIGEWFVGVIIWLYLISPILDKCAVRAPILTLAASLAISFVVFDATADLMKEGRLFGNWMLFIVRVPEFLFGMILFIHREKFLQYRKYLVTGSILFLAVSAAHFVSVYPAEGIFFYPYNPNSFVYELPSIYLFFTAAEVLNERVPKMFEWFNSFNDISYMAMIIQHMIIYVFAAAFNLSDLRHFGMVYLFVLICAAIVVVSEYIKKYSDAAEKFILQRG